MKAIKVSRKAATLTSLQEELTQIERQLDKLHGIEERRGSLRGRDAARFKRLFARESAILQSLEG